MFILGLPYIDIQTPIPVLAQVEPGADFTAEDIPYAPQVEEPIPVSQAPTPDSIAAYGIQGLIISFIFSFGRPLAEKVYLYFNDKEKARRIKEDKALDAQLAAANAQEQQVHDQQNFLQSFMVQQQEYMNKELNAVMTAQREELVKIFNSVQTQTDTLTRLLKTPLEVADSSNDTLIDAIHFQTTTLEAQLKSLQHIVTLPPHSPINPVPTNATPKPSKTYPIKPHTGLFNS